MKFGLGLTGGPTSPFVCVLCLFFFFRSLACSLGISPARTCEWKVPHIPAVTGDPRDCQLQGTFGLGVVSPRGVSHKIKTDGRKPRTMFQGFRKRISLAIYGKGIELLANLHLFWLWLKCGHRSNHSQTLTDTLRYVDAKLLPVWAASATFVQLDRST